MFMFWTPDSRPVPCVPWVLWVPGSPCVPCVPCEPCTVDGTVEEPTPAVRTEPDRSGPFTEPIIPVWPAGRRGCPRCVAAKIGSRLINSTSYFVASPPTSRRVSGTSLCPSRAGGTPVMEGPPATMGEPGGCATVGKVCEGEVGIAEGERGSPFGWIMV